MHDEERDYISNESDRLVDEYMERAARARNTGDKLLGLHLFLAAYGQSLDEHGEPSSKGLCALREAWPLALQLKERSLSEYIFERLAPSLSEEETEACSDSLQNMALDKLEQFGISRKDLEEVSDFIAQELHGVAKDAKDRNASRPPSMAMTKLKDTGADTPSSADKIVLAKFPASQQQQEQEIDFQQDSMRYADLAGYANAIRQAKALGIGEARDPAYAQLVQELNAAHGLSEPPALDPILIVSPSREDAIRFAFATAGELELPIFRMFVEENVQGLQALCLAVQQTNSFKYDRKTGQFHGKGIVLLEDIDLWELPELPDFAGENMNPFMAAQLSRSVSEVYNFIQCAVENPNVTVVATAEHAEDIVPFFASILEPYRTVTIDMPSAGERASIWMQLVSEHPSLAGISVAMLVKNSANMARYDIYNAVADTLDESYRADLSRGRYRPVKPALLFEKLAAFQPLDSEEYKTLEDAIVSDFRRDLSHLDDLLDS